MRLRLREVERAAQRVERIDRDEAMVAASLVQSWRNEHSDTIDAEVRFRLAREIHAGNRDAFAEWEPILLAEIAYVRARAEEWINALDPSDRPRWRRLLAVK